MEPKSFAQELGIDRPDKWKEEAIEESQRFITQKGSMFQRLSLNFIAEQNPELLAFLASVPLLSPALVNVMKLFFCVGYIKGLSDGEDRAGRDNQLKKMWGER